MRYENDDYQFPESRGSRHRARAVSNTGIGCVSSDWSSLGNTMKVCVSHRIAVRTVGYCGGWVVSDIPHNPREKPLQQRTHRDEVNRIHLIDIIASRVP